MARRSTRLSMLLCLAGVALAAFVGLATPAYTAWLADGFSRTMQLSIVFAAGLTIAWVGACIGSFLNVVIFRAPRGLSLSRGGSACPGCHKPIRPWDNVPVLSWIILRGRCRDCGRDIDIQYPLVELTVAILFVIVIGTLLLPGPDVTQAAFVNFQRRVIQATIVINWTCLLIAAAKIQSDELAVPSGWLRYAYISAGILIGLSIAITWQPVAADQAKFELACPPHCPLGAATESLWQAGLWEISDRVLAVLLSGIAGWALASRQRPDVNSLQKHQMSSIAIHHLWILTGLAVGWCGLILTAVFHAAIGPVVRWRHGRSSATGGPKLPAADQYWVLAVSTTCAAVVLGIINWYMLNYHVWASVTD